ncbi:MAG: hypothetical protein M3071_24635 [Actinomycetota bacterium]|nr:hypothetical protein [Actinomycetota bacterium]
MSYKIDPDGYCTTEGCGRPKSSGEEVCALCLVRTTDPEAGYGSADSSPRELKPEVMDFLADEAKLPRCIAYLSKAGDVITLELTGEPKFTEADVELVASALSNLRKAA